MDYYHKYYKYKQKYLQLKSVSGGTNGEKEKRLNLQIIYFNDIQNQLYNLLSELECCHANIQATLKLNLNNDHRKFLEIIDKHLTKLTTHITTFLRIRGIRIGDINNNITYGQAEEHFNIIYKGILEFIPEKISEYIGAIDHDLRKEKLILYNFNYQRIQNPTCSKKVYTITCCDDTMNYNCFLQIFPIKFVRMIPTLEKLGSITSDTRNKIDMEVIMIQNKIYDLEHYSNKTKLLIVEDDPRSIEVLEENFGPTTIKVVMKKRK